MYVNWLKAKIQIQLAQLRTLKSLITYSTLKWRKTYLKQLIQDFIFGVFHNLCPFTCPDLLFIN